MPVLGLLYPRMIPCDLCPGFQDGPYPFIAAQCHIQHPGCFVINREGIRVQTRIITIEKCGVKPSRFNAPEDMSAASYSVPSLS